MQPLLSIDQEKCTACYACVRTCPVNAIKVEADKPKPHIIPERCIGCGNCLLVCPEEAITLISKEKLKVPPETTEDLFNDGVSIYEVIRIEKGIRIFVLPCAIH